MSPAPWRALPRSSAALVLASVALVGCAAQGPTVTQGAVRAPQSTPSAAAALPTVAAGSGLVPPTLKTYGAKLSERRLPAARVPVHLRVAAIGVDQAVTAVGVAADGQLDVPDDAASVSWYRFGSGPTEPGSTVLAGHVDYGGRQGVFWRLDEVAVGQRIEVTSAAGVDAFVVTSTRRYAKTALPVDDLFGRQGTSRLILITCGGSFDRSVSSYRDNVVVTAQPIPRT